MYSTGEAADAGRHGPGRHGLHGRRPGVTSYGQFSY